MLLPGCLFRKHTRGIKMIKEKAIKKLTEIASHAQMNTEKDAIRMAIEALKHTDCEDAISRQEAIDVMAELQGRASTKAELTGISKAWKRIKKLPPVIPKQKWILYSPETKPAFGCYLVTCKNGRIYTGVFTEWGWDIDDVVAYNTMVLPKPYGE